MTTFTATTGNDKFVGTNGIDTVSYALAGATTSGVSISLASAAAQRTGGSGFDTFFSIENLIGSLFGDILSGNAANNIIDGGGGDDTIHGGLGTNTLSGGDGNDLIYSDAAAFHDNLNGGNGDDKLTVYGILGGKIDGGAGSDTLNFSVAQGHFDASSGSANFANIETVQGTIDGTTGNDILSLATLTATGTLAINGGDGNDTIIGGSEIDTIHGGSGTNTLSGGDGNDLIYSDATGFHDNLNGGNGDDKLTVYGILGGKLDGGAGSDTLNFSVAHGHFDASSGSASFANIETVQGTIDGTTGNDIVSLATLTATGTLAINGGDGNDTITGGSEIDTIQGGNGNDRMQGGLGADKLAGGAGTDIFSYTAVNHSGVASSDHIADFLAGTDKIDLHGIDANSVLAGNQDFTFVGTAGFTGLGQVHVSYVGGHAVLSANTTGDLSADLSIMFDNATTITAPDILV